MDTCESTDNDVLVKDSILSGSNENDINKLQDQIKEIREQQHKKFLKKDDDNSHSNENVTWPDKTLCILGDSIITGLDEKRLERNNVKVKVRCFPGCNISDMYDYCKPIIKKRPSNIILHVATNDTINNTSREIVNKLYDLKSFIQSNLPYCKIVISTPTYRSDNARASLTIKHVNDYLLEMMDSDIIDNGNINGTHLGKKGLHLNVKGTGRLAMNIISYMKCL